MSFWDDLKKTARVVGGGALLGLPGAYLGHKQNEKLSQDAPVDVVPEVMPDADSEAVAAARRRKLMMMKSRGGRNSTIRTKPAYGLGSSMLAGEDPLGGA